MKKVLLSSVAALAVFAAAAPVFANNQGTEFVPGSNKQALQGSDIFDDNAADQPFRAGLTQRGKDGLNNVDADSTKAKFKAAGEDIKPKLDKDGKPIPGEFVVTGKAKAAGKDAAKPGAAKASAAAGQKALPKTSAAK